MKFLVCKKQHGEGCDYTIGCGMNFNFIEAKSAEDAVEKIIYPYGHDEASSLEGESALKEIFIVQADYVISIDVNKVAQEVANQRKQQALGLQKRKEITEFKKLKAKYNL